MTKRFRMVAGPNGSGKTTLMRRLAADYAVNFYDILNADDIFAEVCRTNAYLPPMPVEPDALCRYAEDSSYPDDEINADRVAERVLQGGHDVPREKIKVRFRRSLDNLSRAFPYLSRAFFFDNSGDRMRYLAQWNAREGFSIEHDRRLPHWASFMEMSAHGEGDRTIPGYAH